MIQELQPALASIGVASSSDPRVDECTKQLVAAGASIRTESEAGSRYFEMPDGTVVRLSDHPPNTATANWMLREKVAAILVDKTGCWRKHLEDIIGPPIPPAHRDTPFIDATQTTAYFGDYSRWSQSMLKTFAERRRLCDAYYVSQLLAEPPRTGQGKLKIVRGTATHTALLEPDRFENLVVTYPPGILASNGAVSTIAAKDFRKEYEAAGRVVLKEDEFAAVKAMAASVCHVCGEWLDLPSRKEQSIYWTDEATGLPLKMRFDWLVIGNRPVIFDLKTTADASPGEFRKRCEQNGYGVQHAQYIDGVSQVTGQTPLFYFIAVEDSFPFACSIHELDDNSAAESRAYRNKLLVDLKQCLDSGDWSETWERKINKIRLRDWSFDKME